ncbi:MAG: TraR/DksA C4-type zinc finger protein [Planctomycetota bacterium]
MAKKTTKKTTKKTSKKAGSAVGSSASKTAKKPTSKKTVTKKTGKKAAAKTTKKPAGKKTTKKAASKATTKKPTAKKAPAKKAASKKAATKKAASKKATGKKTAASGSGSKTSDKKAGSSAAGKAPGKAAGGKPEAADNGTTKKPVRKGITIVSNKPARKPKAKVDTSKFVAPGRPLLGPGMKTRRPLIPSGPKNEIESDSSSSLEPSKKRKSPFTKKQLQDFRAILVMKRASLTQSVDDLETQALKSQSGALSHTPQHMAEQGSEVSDQTLSLDLAKADRSLIAEIDAAIERIDNGTFGVCEMTGEPINRERLEELPWARYSIEAARRMERGPMRR